MKRETFILLQKKTFRHTIKFYLKGADNKIDQRNAKFTTEHKVSEKERNKNARKIAAEFSTTDEVLIDAMYRDTGYGITFIHADDPEAKRKKEPFIITPMDAKKIALKNLFEAANIPFDQSKSSEVLAQEYEIQVKAKTGVTLTKSTASEIPHEKVDVHQGLIDTANAAREVYFERYGETIPDKFKNDIAFLSALSNPNWDAKAYMAENSTEEDPVVSAEEEGNDLPDTAEELGKLYFAKFNKNVATPKKNDVAWIKKQLLS